MPRRCTVSAVLTAVTLVVGAHPAAAASIQDVERVHGHDRYATAAAAALSGWASASTVVVASGRGGSDALAASYLAGTLEAPVVLTDRDQASPEALDAIRALGPERVVVLGGEAAVSREAFDALTARREASRVEGADRYATAVEVLESSAGEPLTVFLARGDVAAGVVLADALAASPEMRSASGQDR